MPHIGTIEIKVSLNNPNQLDISQKAMIKYCKSNGIVFENTFNFKYGLRRLMVLEHAEGLFK